ncbi:hypothetical protein BKA65DRAFT_220715 [Rhexocercosporidium sp. MPI-PUGE-AT-0058]|nr:hypothetical protein BKA65DRAFT_220715 [Rhexocercosporidium sp. MPI-PUGE-AT-0058]
MALSHSTVTAIRGNAFFLPWLFSFLAVVISLVVGTPRPLPASTCLSFSIFAILSTQTPKHRLGTLQTCTCQYKPPLKLMDTKPTKRKHTARSTAEMPCIQAITPSTVVAANS